VLINVRLHAGHDSVSQWLEKAAGQLKLVQEDLSQKQGIVAIKYLNPPRTTVANIDHDP
jgi:hypothetical protein